MKNFIRQLVKRQTQGSLHKRCLIKPLFYVSLKHTYFQQLESNIFKGLSYSDLLKLKELNTSMFRLQRLLFFKTEPEKDKPTKLNKRVHKLKTQLEIEMKKQTDRVGKLQQLKQALIEIQSNQNFSLNYVKFELQEESQS